MNWWQFLLLVLGIGIVSWIVPALIYGYVWGAVVGSALGKPEEQP